MLEFLGRLATVDSSKQEAPRVPTLAESFAEQWGWVTTPERQNLVMVARQSGKSFGAVLRACLVALSNPNRRVIYVTLSRPNARQLFFDPAIEFLLDRMDIKVEPNLVDLRLDFPNGSKIYCRSADTVSQTRKARGPNWDEAILDEVNDFPDETLRLLVQNVLGPTLFRRQGAISLLFTPPTIQKGWLWNEFNSGRWKLWNWPQSANPFLPPGEAERWLEKSGLTWDSPVARRELLGLWEPDITNQVFDLNEVRNSYDTLPPELPGNAWRYALGEDIGWEHDDSICVVAWNIYDPLKRIFEVLTWSQRHQDIDQTFAKFKEVWVGHRPMMSVVMDQAGAGGQKVIATIQNRFQASGVPLEIEYKPSNVPASVGIVNDNARTGRLLLRRNSPLWQDVPHVVWKTDSNRQEIDKGRFDSHGLDALRYAVWGASNFLARAPKPEMTADEKRRHRRSVIARRENRQRW